MILSKRLTRLRVLAVAILVALTGPGAAHSHGGKTHGDEPFSAFLAVQKAAALYDRLITSGKLGQEWETELASIHVDIRSPKSNREYVVQFKLNGSDPNSVYFYFDRQGVYSGSNFTGK